MGAFAAQVLALCLFLLFVLEEEVLAAAFFSGPTWAGFVAALGGMVRATPDGVISEVPLLSLFALSLAGSALSVAGRCAVLRFRAGRTWDEALLGSCLRTAVWTIPAGIWAALWLAASLLGSPGLLKLLVLTVHLTLAFTLAGWLWEWLSGAVRTQPAPSPPLRSQAAREGDGEKRRTGLKAALENRPLVTVVVAVILFSVTFVAMNWGLWFNLRIPHGDSAMYEEHLWNLLHGKGFRSYLDQGLFLGEHIQVIHVLLMPLYVFWPSHLLLELCETLALAGGAFFVYRITKRHTGHGWASAWMAVAYLLYFPLHYLDIAIDLKTFRPIAFGIPIMLWGIDSMERRRWGMMSLAFVLALACKEDYALVLAPLGLWLGATSWWSQRNETEGGPGNLRSSISPGLVIGLAVCLLATLYLVFVVKIAIPWFRDWETVHYARYFSRFGETPTEIVWTMLTRPGFTLQQFVTAGSAAYLLQVLLPLGFVSLGFQTGSRWVFGKLRAPGRLLVAAPLFLLLCLNELAQETPGPVHHFHAPLIPLVVWAACAGLGAIRRGGKRERGGGGEGSSMPNPQPWNPDAQRPTLDASLWSVCCALTTAVFFSLSPVGISFWDTGSRTYWRTLYLPDERARQFENVYPRIPRSARIASTDFVHPRFTHHERSYDYSDYLRKAADYQPKVPDETDYIVIDTQHPYSRIRSPEEVRELREAPDEWELLPIDSGGYFIVLRRMRESGERVEGGPPPERRER